MPMPALIPHRPCRWAWPAAWVGVLLLLTGATLVPETWWWLLVPDRYRGREAELAAPAALELLELEVLPPPPPIAIAPDDARREPPAPAPHLDPDWWTRGWNARIVPDLAPARPELPDSLLPRPLLDILGAQATLDLVLAQPDSVVQARIWWLTQEEQLSRDDLDGLFGAIAKARAYADLKSREAAMYDEFINETVPVPR